VPDVQLLAVPVLVDTMVAHSILLDDQGFPFLAEYCYHNLTGSENMAITAITCEDVSLEIKEILGNVDQLNYICVYCYIIFIATARECGR